MSELLPLRSPNTGRVFEHWRPMPPAAIAAAVEAADRALDTLEDPDARRRVLERCAAGLAERRQALADLVVREVGKKPEEALGEVDYAIAFLDDARKAMDEIAFERRPGGGRLICERPYRAALLIAPFNDPLAGLARKIGPAVAAGAPALVKPSRLGQLCAEAMLGGLRDAGAGAAVQLVAPEDNQAVERLIADHRIGAVSFTGSTEVGRWIASLSAEYGKKAVLELGGNCPFVVCADADLERAVEDLVVRKLKAAGQACSSVNRVFVAAPRYDAFKTRLAARTAGLRLAPSDTPGVDLGPLRTRAATEGLREAVARAVDRGERLLTAAPAEVPPEAPFLFPFTLVEAESGSVFDGFESFGPVLSLRAFDSLDALLARLERERHALVAYFYTAEPQALLPRLGRLRFGSLGLNTTAIQGTDVPTGGFWDAGIGREGGAWGLREFLAPVNVRIGSD